MRQSCREIASYTTYPLVKYLILRIIRSESARTIYSWLFFQTRNYEFYVSLVAIYSAQIWCTIDWVGSEYYVDLRVCSRYLNSCFSIIRIRVYCCLLFSPPANTVYFSFYINGIPLAALFIHHRRTHVQIISTYVSFFGTFSDSFLSR